MKNNKTQLENELTNSLQSDYSTIQLAPFGRFPHAKGMQVVDTESAETLVKNFNSFFARLGRRFAGVPFFIGHPDVPGFENEFPDKKAYGWVMELSVREDGLWGRTKWSRAGQELIENAHYKFLSPFWEAGEVGFEQGRKVYRPHTLISVGLTNNPNLPVLPLANEGRSSRAQRDRMQFFGNTLPIFSGQPGQESSIQRSNELENEPETEANHEQVEEYHSDHFAIHEDDPTNENEEDHFIMNNNNEPNKTENQMDIPSTATMETTPPGRTPLNGGRSPVNGKSSPESSAASLALQNNFSRLENSFSKMEARLAEVNNRVLTVLVDNAISDGRITPADRQRWFQDLNRDFAAKSVELANVERVVKTDPLLENFVQRTQQFDGPQSRSKYIQKLIQRRCTNSVTPTTRPGTK